jgi:hypothetical protein
MLMPVRRHLATVVLSATVARSGTGSAADSVEMGSATDLVAAGSVFETDSGSASFLDSVLVSIRSFSADAGVVVLDSVGAGIRGGGDTRIGEVMAGTGTMTPGRIVQT